MPSRALLAVVVALSASSFAWLQSQTPHLLDRDSYYHARYAQLLPERGLSREFEWTQVSIWRDQFSDKEFLYHAFLAPFCRGERLEGGAKVATWILQVGFLGVMALLLVGNGFRAPWLWLLLVPALGNHFLFRMLEVRAHVLSVSLLLLGVHFLLQRKPLALWIVGFVYSWSYAAPHVLVGFACVHAIASSFDEGRFVWRPLAASAMGVFAGLVLHPYFPNDLRLWWVQNVLVLSAAWGSAGDSAIRLGAEFSPVTTREFFLTATLPALCLGGTLLAAVFRRRELSSRTRALVACAAAAFVLYCLSAKLVEYFAPLALLAFASLVSDLWPEGPATWKRVLAVVLLVAIGGGVLWKSLSDTRKAVGNYPGPELEGAATWIRQNVEKGETIVHLDWGDFPELFYFDPTHRYLVGLDPMFAFERNASKMRLLEEVRARRRPLDPGGLAFAFDARYLIVRRRWMDLANDALLTPVYEDRSAAVYRLRD